MFLLFLVLLKTSFLHYQNLEKFHSHNLPISFSYSRGFSLGMRDGPRKWPNWQQSADRVLPHRSKGVGPREGSLVGHDAEPQESRGMLAHRTVSDENPKLKQEKTTKGILTRLESLKHSEISRKLTISDVRRCIAYYRTVYQEMLQKKYKFLMCQYSFRVWYKIIYMSVNCIIDGVYFR